MSKSEINSVLDEYSDMYMKDTSLNEDTFDFLDAMRQRLPPSVPLTDPAGTSGSESSDTGDSSNHTGSIHNNSDTHIDIEPYLYESDSSDIYISNSSSSNSSSSNPTTEFDVWAVFLMSHDSKIKLIYMTIKVNQINIFVVIPNIYLFWLFYSMTTVGFSIILI